MVDFDKQIRYIKGVGPARVELLNKLGLYTLEDIVTYFPRDYEDRGKYKAIAELENEETVAFRAIVTSKPTENRIRKGMTIYKAIAKDETGSILLTWYNQSYIKNTLLVGKEYIFYGKVKKGKNSFLKCGII